MAQTFNDYEVLVCDDASSQDVAGALAAFGDTRVQHMRINTNLGMAANNMRGYQAARGDYLAHLDDDDEWEPGFLEVLVGHLNRHPECSLAFCDHAVIDANSKIDRGLSDQGTRDWSRGGLRDGVYQPFVEIAVVHRSIPMSHAAVVRRSSVDLRRFTSDVGYSWDLWLAYLACRHGGGAHYTRERLARYRMHGAQVSGGVTDLGTYETLTYCDRRFLADRELIVDRGALIRRLALTSAYWSVALTRLGRPHDARQVGWSGLRVRATLAGVAALTLAYTPERLASGIARVATTVAVSLRRIRAGVWQRLG